MLISTIIPVFNGAAWLDAALESVLAQDHEPLEVIVVDDGSVDGSAHVASIRSEVTVISIPHQGVAVARNVGLQTASGSLIAFLDADDLWESGKLPVQAEFLATNRTVDGVFGWVRDFLDTGIDRPDWLRRGQLDRDTPGVSLCTLLVRKEVFGKVGSFNPEIGSGEDVDWFFRAKDAGINFEMMDRRFLRRRIHKHNLSHDGRAVRAGILGAVRASLTRKQLQD